MKYITWLLGKGFWWVLTPAAVLILLFVYLIGYTHGYQGGRTRGDAVCIEQLKHYSQTYQATLPQFK